MLVSDSFTVNNDNILPALVIFKCCCFCFMVNMHISQQNRTCLLPDQYDDRYLHAFVWPERHAPLDISKLCMIDGDPQYIFSNGFWILFYHISDERSVFRGYLTIHPQVCLQLTQIFSHVAQRRRGSGFKYSTQGNMSWQSDSGEPNQSN